MSSITLRYLIHSNAIIASPSLAPRNARIQANSTREAIMRTAAWVTVLSLSFRLPFLAPALSHPLLWISAGTKNSWYPGRYT